MNYRFGAPLALVLGLIAFSVAPASAQDRGSVAGQFGVTFQSETAPVFAGEVSFNVAPLIQVYGTVGRMQDALPSDFQDVVDFIDPRIDASLPTTYLLGGVRAIFPVGAVRPYGLFGVGMAHLSGDFEFNGQDITDDVEFELGEDLSSNEFAFELGGGVLFDVTPSVFIDGGYRYMRITGADLNVSRVYGGVGFKF